MSFELMGFVYLDFKGVDSIGPAFADVICLSEGSGKFPVELNRFAVVLLAPQKKFLLFLSCLLFEFLPLTFNLGA